MREGINVLLALMIIASFLLAIPLHEWAHVIMASWLGDQAPRAEGRQTLNLRAHIDPIGTLLCVVLAFQSAVGFGWGKPVKPDPWKLRLGTDRGIFVVACAGPIFSLIVGLATALVAHLFLIFMLQNVSETQIVLFSFLERILQFLIVFATVNIGIALLNILPFYPLDGYQILYTLLPSKQAVQFSRSAPYGPFIILILFFFLPFLGQLSGASSFPLFALAEYIRLGAISLISLVFGAPFSNSFNTIASFYLL